MMAAITAPPDVPVATLSVMSRYVDSGFVYSASKQSSASIRKSMAPAV